MTNKSQASGAEQRAQACTEGACIPGQSALPVWRASVRMALVCAAGVVAAGLIATGIGGCADMSGIAPQASLRDAASLGMGTAAAPTLRRRAGALKRRSAMWSTPKPISIQTSTW